MLRVLLVFPRRASKGGRPDKYYFNVNHIGMMFAMIQTNEDSHFFPICGGTVDWKTCPKNLFEFADIRAIFPFHCNGLHSDTMI